MPKPAPCRAHSSPQYLMSGCDRVSSTTPTFIPLVSIIFPGAAVAGNTRRGARQPAPEARAAFKNMRRSNVLIVFALSSMGRLRRLKDRRKVVPQKLQMFAHRVGGGFGIPGDNRSQDSRMPALLARTKLFNQFARAAIRKSSRCPGRWCTLPSAFRATPRDGRPRRPPGGNRSLARCTRQRSPAPGCSPRR